MDFSTNHPYQVGDIVTTMGRQITVPTPHEVWDTSGERGCFKEVNNGQVAIRLTLGKGINTGFVQQGLVCYLPACYRGVAILSVRITRIGNKSVQAEPEEYIETHPPLDASHIGQDALSIYNSFSAYPEIPNVATCNWVKRASPSDIAEGK